MRFLRKIWIKVVNKEKKKLEDLKRITNSDLSSLRALLAAKEKWLDELKSKKVKLDEMVARDKRITTCSSETKEVSASRGRSGKITLEGYLSLINLPTTRQEFAKTIAKHRSLSG